MNIKKVLITGITGSGGSYLADYIVTNHPEVEVYGVSRWHSGSTLKNLSSIKEKVTVYPCDLNDFSAIFRVLRNIKPDVIFHLAAHANVQDSFSNPLAVASNNIFSTINLFEAMRLAEIDPIVQLCSTSEVYGAVDVSYIPIKEDCPLSPVNPYAVTKLYQDRLAFSYYKSYGMKNIITRMFSYINPRRITLAATHFAMQIARIEYGLQKELVHGNLHSVRSWCDVRDVAEVYYIAALRCRPGQIYNLGNTDAIYSVGEILSYLKSMANCSIKTKLDDSLVRPIDVDMQIPCTDKFYNETGWKPRYSFEESMEYLLDYCRKEAIKELSS